MNAQDLQLDYFKIYDVVDYEAEFQGGLQGQFDVEPTEARLLFLTGFANRASKNGEPLYDPNAHLTWYQLYQPGLRRIPTWFVTVENQFGTQEISIGLNAWRERTRIRELRPFVHPTAGQYTLLAPAQKGEEGEFPVDLNYFKLYWVVEGEPVDRRVRLQDQFGREEVEVADPIAFGVPVRVLYQQQVYPIHHSEAHLVIYQIEQRKLESPLTRTVVDQFGTRDLSFRGSIALAVPSVKVDWKEL
jgi:hypothetical protein